VPTDLSKEERKQWTEAKLTEQNLGEHLAFYLHYTFLFYYRLFIHACYNYLLMIIVVIFLIFIV